ncbi:MAG: response regulator [Deltaproteobacteria bacterium]|nr:response regulator [Deltaproteobacteria bacterium]
MSAENPLEVLLVDDDPDFLGMLGDLLEAEGHRVHRAPDAHAALTVVRAHRVEVAFLDVRMPGVNGVELLRLLRREAPALSVVMMTGYSLPDLVAQAWQEGALAILPKPLPLPRVVGFLARFRENPRLLVVDDDPAFCEFLSEALGGAASQIVTTGDPQQALRLAAQGEYDLVFLDLKLPRITGFELLDALKQVKPQLTVVLVTAYSQELGPVIRQERVQSQILYCFPKPVDLVAIRALLLRVATRRHMEALGVI